MSMRDCLDKKNNNNVNAKKYRYPLYDDNINLSLESHYYVSYIHIYIHN